jgi:hypothetical protein
MAAALTASTERKMAAMLTKAQQVYHQQQRQEYFDEKERLKELKDCAEPGQEFEDAKAAYIAHLKKPVPTPTLPKPVPSAPAPVPSAPAPAPASPDSATPSPLPPAKPVAAGISPVSMSAALHEQFEVVQTAAPAAEDAEMEEQEEEVAATQAAAAAAEALSGEEAAEEGEEAVEEVGDKRKARKAPVVKAPARSSQRTPVPAQRPNL